MTEEPVPEWIRSAIPDAAIIARPDDGAFGLWEIAIRSDRGAMGPERHRSEVEVLARVRQAGWHAHWIPGLGQEWIWSKWPNDVSSVRAAIKSAPPGVRDTLRKVRMAVRGKRGPDVGWPDLVLWNASGVGPRFLEVKGPKESMTPAQRLWCARVLRSSAIKVADLAICRYRG